MHGKLSHTVRRSTEPCAVDPHITLSCLTPSPLLLCWWTWIQAPYGSGKFGRVAPGIRLTRKERLAMQAKFGDAAAASASLRLQQPRTVGQRRGDEPAGAGFGGRDRRAVARRLDFACVDPVHETRRTTQPARQYDIATAKASAAPASSGLR